MAILSVASSSSATATVVGSSDRYVGRFRRGDTLLASFVLSSVADCVPHAYVVDDGGFISNRFLFLSPDGSGTKFESSIFIDGEYEVGLYTVEFYATINGEPVVMEFDFDVVEGGDAGGAVISMHSVDRPEVRSLVVQLEGGQLVLGKGPEVAS